MVSRQRRIAALATGAGLLLCLLANAAVAQSRACTLTPDKRNPNDKILHCGSELTITPAPGTVYRAGTAGADGLPRSVQLDSGALLIEFNPRRRQEFQILTPQAIASVRGTKWAMDVTPMQTSTLVLTGEVTVARKNETENVVVGPGQGVDIEVPPGGNTPRLSMALQSKPDPITVKQWGAARVNALLDRFGP
jgi:ferric-dicitrate binding protein FerR (iron transport regulator)